MSEWRPTGSICPLEPPGHVEMDFCQACRFFRGASSKPHERGWNINCNWPRNGSQVEREPVPPIFLDAFRDDASLP